MQRPLRRALFIALVAFAAGALPSLAAAPTGSVNGIWESAINDIKECQNLEKYAKGLADEAGKGGTLPNDIAEDVHLAITDALDLLAEIKANIAEGGPYPPKSNETGAIASISDAQSYDLSALRYVNEPGRADSVSDFLKWADDSKRNAKYYLQQVLITRKDAAALAANPEPPTLAVDGDVAHWKKFAKVTPEDVANGSGDILDAIWKALAEPIIKYPYAKDPADLHAKTPKPPKNYYFAFTGKKPEAGYVYKSLGRPLFGPFEVKFQVGAFDPNATEDTGSACVEFDVQGSDPLQFLAVCGRRLNGGVQVFAQSHQGAAGNVFLAGARIAQVRVQYSGTQFICSAAAGKDAPDFVMTQFSTYNLAQGSTPLVAGIGGSGLVKGATIGLDEIYFTPK